MQLDQIMGVLRHCYERQTRQGAESAFRFALVVGSNRKRVFATYPERSKSPEKRGTRSPDKRSKKAKGKQRDITQLDGLLPISQTDHPNRLPSTGTSHISTVPSSAAPATDQDHVLVVIGMGEVHQLRQLGCEDIFGPINGPSEGQPKYQVPHHWLQRLPAARDPHQAETTARPYPRPRPIHARRAQSGSTTVPSESVIDPNLLQPPTLGIPTIGMPGSSIAAAESVPLPPSIPVQDGNADSSHPHPGISLPEASLTLKQTTSIGGPGQRTQIQKSPSRPVTRSSRKHKVMTSDVLASQEAEQLLKGTKSSRRQKTRS